MRALTQHFPTSGVTGVIAAGGSLALSTMSTLEIGLRVAALVLGCLVSIATLVHLGLKIRAARRKEQEEDEE